MTNELTQRANGGAIERALIDGDLSGLSNEERLAYYKSVCESVGLNPLTKPFAYIRLNNKLTLYALKDATDQLRASRGVSVTKLERERIDDVYAVTAYATDKSGRTDSSIGAVAMMNLRGDALANALMKAETKAKRRVTLSICGLGMLDETEIETIRDAQPFTEVVTREIETTAPTTPPLPADVSAAVTAATSQSVSIPSAKQNGNGHTQKDFSDLVNAHKIKDASKIVKAHTSNGAVDWNAAYMELQALLPKPA